MILLLGASGYVGQKFAELLSERSVDFLSLSRADFDYYDSNALAELIRDEKISFLINCAGYTGKPNVDACELDKTSTLLGNAILPGRINEACVAAGIAWGHVSSGCIYTGRREDGELFTEEDEPNFSFRTNNCSFYSGTKALGEEVLADAEQCYIWRLRIPFNEEVSPRNYLTKLMRYSTLLEAENSISHLEEFVAACWSCWEKKVPFGIYNVTNPGVVTTSLVTKWIEEEADVRKENGEPNPFPEKFSFFEDESQFMQQAAKTPRSNCSMSSDKLAKAGIVMRPVEEAVRDALRQYGREKSVTL